MISPEDPAIRPAFSRPHDLRQREHADPLPLPGETGYNFCLTRGLLWAWFIHFVPDAAIFAAYAILWVQR